MPTSLPAIDLTGAVVGTNGSVDLNTLGLNNQNPSVYKTNPPIIYLLNDSGCGLFIQFDTGESFNIGAGGWVPHPIPAGANNFQWKVIYVLPNPPVSLLMMTVYYSYEQVPNMLTLGNSPVGIGGTVNTSSVQTLSNEGTAAGLLVIDTGDTSFTQLFTLFNDGHTTWAVDQSGVKHQVIKVQTAGNPLQLGQAGDISEVLGKLTVDQLLTASLGLDVINGIITDTLSVSSTSTFTGTATHNGNIIANGGENINTIRDNVNGNTAIDLSNGDGTVALPQLLRANAPAAFTHAGSGGGTLNIYTPVWGSGLKILILTVSSYIDSAVQHLNFISNLSFGIGVIMGFGSSATISLFKSGVAQSLQVITSLASTGGGSSGVTTVHSNSIFANLTGADQIQISTVASAITGTTILVGV